MIIKCNINEETFKIDYFGKFILVDYKNYFLKHAEKFYVDIKYDRNLNLNCDLTYKKYVKNNFRNLVNNGLDIILPNNIVGFLKKNYPNLVKERVYDKVNCRYWKKTNLWCYNNFKDVLKPDMVSPEIGNDLYVIFNKHKYFINLNKKIDNNVLYLLGLIFTD